MLVIAGPLSQIWSLIQSIQLMNYFSLFTIKSPGNVNSLMRFIAELAKFNILGIDFDQIVQDTIYLPEQEPFTLNFVNAGYNSSFLLPNLGSMLILITIHASFHLMHVGVYVISLFSKKAKGLNNRFSVYLYWNGTVKTYMEVFLDITLFSFLNVKELSWKHDIPGVKACNTLAILTVIFSFALPVTFIVLLVMYHKKGGSSSLTFRKKMRSLTDDKDNRRDKRCPIITITFLYFASRLQLAIVLVYWQSFLWGQLAIQFIVTIAMLIVVQWWKPFESPFLNKVETVNILVQLVMLYMMLCFSDFTDKPETRHMLGKVFVGIICGFVLIHVTIMMAGSCK